MQNSLYLFLLVDIFVQSLKSDSSFNLYFGALEMRKDTIHKYKKVDKYIIHPEIYGQTEDKNKRSGTV